MPISEVEECPSFLSDEEAAATPLAALTAWRATLIKAGVKAGDHVLITGIGGGVALFCLQLAVAYGAKVYVSSGSEEKLEKAERLGASGGVNYKDSEWTKRLAEMLPADHPFLDSVIDSAGGDIVMQSLRLLRFGGVISSYGMTLGPKTVFPMQAVMKNIEVSNRNLQVQPGRRLHLLVQRFDDGLTKRIQGRDRFHWKTSNPAGRGLSLLYGRRRFC